MNTRMNKKPKWLFRKRKKTFKHCSLWPGKYYKYSGMGSKRINYGNRPEGDNYYGRIYET